MKYLILICVLMTACIGTDYTDEALILNEASLEISPQTFNLAQGQSLQITVSATNISGDKITPEISWRSDQISVATVSNQGLISAISKGEAHIIAEYTDELSEKHSDTCHLTVIDADDDAVGGITIIGDKTSLIPEATTHFSATVLSTTGLVLPLPVTWHSSQPEVATIDAQGNVKAISVGETKISASIDQIKSNEITLKVLNAQGRSGTFVGKTGHRVSGTVTISADESTLTLEEDFQTQSGPGLQVYLSKSADSGSGGIDLGAVKSNSGQQTYAIPSSVNVSDFSHVLIYCKPFSVVFGAAELK